MKLAFPSQIKVGKAFLYIFSKMYQYLVDEEKEITVFLETVLYLLTWG